MVCRRRKEHTLRPSDPLGVPEEEESEAEVEKESAASDNSSNADMDAKHPQSILEAEEQAQEETAACADYPPVEGSRCGLLPMGVQATEFLGTPPNLTRRSAESNYARGYYDQLRLHGLTNAQK